MRKSKQIIVAYRDELTGELIAFATAYNREQADYALALLHRTLGVWGIRMDHRECRRQQAREETAR